MEEIYVSTDVESDGPIPGPNSMLSFGSAAFSAAGERLATYSANLELLPGASADVKTSVFWREHKAAYEATRAGARAAEVVMPEYASWLDSLPGKPVFVGFPATYDFMFVYWYLIRFAGRSPFSHSGLDMKTYAMAMLKIPYRKCVKREFPKRWFPSGHPHTHIALDDAIEQGITFCRMMAEHRGGGRGEADGL